MRWLVPVTLALLTGPAAAHAMLEHSNPGAGTVLSASPARVTLEFTESLEPAFSNIAVTDAAGHDVTSSPSVAKGATMVVRLKTLSPGTYRVKWKALSVDTHHTEGSFGFSLKQ